MAHKRAHPRHHRNVGRWPARTRHHPGSKAARDRVSDKISKLLSSGEAKSQDQAVAIAHSMEKRGELGPRGGKKS